MNQLPQNETHTDIQEMKKIGQLTNLIRQRGWVQLLKINFKQPSYDFFEE